MTTLTVTPILSGCCGEYFGAYAPYTSDVAHCLHCLREVSVATDIAPNMGEWESLTWDRGHSSGVRVLGYVTAGE